MKKVKVAPFDVLNITGLNTLSLSGNFNPLGDEKDFIVQVGITKEDNPDGPMTPMHFGSVNTSVKVSATLAGSPEDIANDVISQLKLKK